VKNPAKTSQGWLAGFGWSPSLVSWFIRLVLEWFLTLFQLVSLVLAGQVGGQAGRPA